ncbi:hypothetical protein HPG69_010921 [Diceros bicornis minor]|uniref:ARHGAP20 PH domain-containing protein n=1 Tax=Diceros bicornis minor TaxID=77932 RepID=A0A7J7EGE2_DICBM|nr:hypothetical protein HPG69_010921 [Diceros bicornis minor]
MRLIYYLPIHHSPLTTESYSPPRKSLASAASLQQLDLQLDLPDQQGEPILHSPVLLTQGPETKEKHLLLFRDWLVIAKRSYCRNKAEVEEKPEDTSKGKKTKGKHTVEIQITLGNKLSKRSSKSYRFKQKLPLSDLRVVSCDTAEEQEEDEDGDLIIRRGNALFFIMASDPCVTEFP